MNRSDNADGIYQLGVAREFNARHYLIGGDWGAENIEHAHHYRLELVLEKKVLDRHGFLVDIVEVERHLTEVVAQFAGKTLNALPDFSGVNPSIERLATILHGLFGRRFTGLGLDGLRVTVHEDDIAWTSYQASP